MARRNKCTDRTVPDGRDDLFVSLFNDSFWIEQVK
jgi:hypothetical protein